MQLTANLDRAVLCYFVGKDALALLAYGGEVCLKGVGDKQLLTRVVLKYDDGMGCDVKDGLIVLPKLLWSSPLYNRKVCGWHGNRPEEAGNQPFFQQVGGLVCRTTVCKG